MTAGEIDTNDSDEERMFLEELDSLDYPTKQRYASLVLDYQINARKKKQPVPLSLAMRRDILGEARKQINAETNYPGVNLRDTHKKGEGLRDRRDID